VKKQLGNILKPALVLFIICLIITAALAFTYSETKDVIEERARIDAENARREVLSSAESFEAVDDISRIAGSNESLSLVEEAYKGLKGETVVGYVFSVVTKGYGGDVKIMVGIDTSGRITGVKMGEHSETPGLGSKAEEEPFKSRLYGFVPGEPLVVVKREPAKAEEIEAISGATVTSKAVVKGIQAAVDMWTELGKKEGVQG